MTAEDQCLQAPIEPGWNSAGTHFCEAESCQIADTHLYASTSSSADASFDVWVNELWALHLDSLGPEVAKTKNKGGTYWQLWYDGIDFAKASLEGAGRDCDRKQRRGSADVTLDNDLASRDTCGTSELRGHGVEQPELFSMESLMAARLNFAKFHGVSVGEVDDVQVANSSLGIAGWADSKTRVLDDDEVGKVVLLPEGSCWAFGDERSSGDASGGNDQVLRLIIALGRNGSGRRAIIKALADRQGIVDEDELEQLYSGRARLREVPRSMRNVLREVGLGDVLPEVNLITTSTPTEVLVADDKWEDLEFEVALDSGSVVHVCAPGDIPGYLVQESPGSKRGQEFLMGDGGTIPNLGESQLNLSEGDHKLQSVFQIAAVTRPLMSVGRICDQGHSITFNAVMAVVHSADGTELCKFERQPGGLYIAKLKLRSPAGFGGQE